MSYLEIWAITLLICVTVTINVGLICAAYKEVNKNDARETLGFLSELQDIANKYGGDK